LWPRITLVTPVRNSARYVEAAIRSVVLQDYPDLEYIVVDGGSTDGTLDVIRRHEKAFSWWISEADEGMYDALNKALSRSTGEIMGWLSATDRLHPGALRTVGTVFRQFPEVDWMTGRPSYFKEDGMIEYVGPVPHWSRLRYLLRTHLFIQQESTFWRRRLWEKAGGSFLTRRLAGDFELWLRFFRHARLYPVRCLVGGYRSHPDSLWLQNREAYRSLCEGDIRNELDGGFCGTALRAFAKSVRAARRVALAGWVWTHLVERFLYRLPGPDCPPTIRRTGERWTMSRGFGARRRMGTRPSTAQGGA
jgi:glycosyltransferase involved in cell wall biosynthesis